MIHAVTGKKQQKKMGGKTKSPPKAALAILNRNDAYTPIYSQAD